MTVQAAVLKFIQKIDPTMTDMTVITSSNLATWVTNGGDKLDAQELLNIFNDARMAVFEEFREKLGDDVDKLGKTVGAQLVSNTAFTMTLTGSIAVGTKPTGFIKFNSMSNAAGQRIVLLPPSMIEEVRATTPSPHYTQSSTNIFIFDIGTQLVHYGTVITTLSTYRLVYFGISNWALTDVTTGTAVETYTDDQIANLIIPKAIKIALSRGLQIVETPSQGV